MFNRLPVFTVFILCGLGGLAPAAVAPMSPERLRITATHILKGKVLEVKAKTRGSKVERAVGIHLDRFFTIRLEVAEVSKGAGVKPGGEVVIVAWQPAVRIPPVPGPQGHWPIPRKGQVVTIHVASREGASFAPIVPNGIRIEDPKPAS